MATRKDPSVFWDGIYFVRVSGVRMEWSIGYCRIVGPVEVGQPIELQPVHVTAGKNGYFWRRLRKGPRHSLSKNLRYVLEKLETNVGRESQMIVKKITTTN